MFKKCGCKSLSCKSGFSILFRNSTILAFYVRYHELLPENGEAKVEKNLQKVDPICEEEFGIAKLRESILWYNNPCRGVVNSDVIVDVSFSGFIRK